MQVRFLPGALKEKARLCGPFLLSSLRFRARDCLSETGLLAVCRVLLDNTGLRRLVDCLKSSWKGLLSFLKVGADSLLHYLSSVSKGALAAHVENVLLEGCAVRLLCVLRNCHCRPDSTAFRSYAQEMLRYSHDPTRTRHGYGSGSWGHRP